MREYLYHDIDDPHLVSDIELRQIVKLLLQHLKLDAVRYRGHGASSDDTYIELERDE